MQHFQLAMETTTSHGLPRMVTNKPMHVRMVWLLLFLLMLGLCLKGLSDFIVKWQTNQPTNTLEANSVNFQFPDVYVCFENPISGSYAANVDKKMAEAINGGLNASKAAIDRFLASMNQTGEAAKQVEIMFSFLYPHSLQYTQLTDGLAHRLEQSVINSQVTYSSNYGQEFQPLEPATFYHPEFLRCLRWKLNETQQSNIVQSGSSAGIVAKIMIDGNHTDIASSGAYIQPKLFIDNMPLSISDWSLSISDFQGTDRTAGVRVFLTPPNEYPSDFVSSFSLGPGKHHTVEIGMTQQVYKDGQFECLTDAPDVQFVNPYDQTPYSHAYSYSYCYYYEYHRQYQALINMSGEGNPLPWPLRGYRYYVNLTGTPNFFVFFGYGIVDPEALKKIDSVHRLALDACRAKRPCNTLDYDVSISSADWPTQSSLAPFVSSAVKQAWTSAKAKNLSVPALDFLVTGNASSVASYVRSNLLKVHFKPHRVTCDRVTFSRDYGALNFISDVGGIMGIYLGMSLLTLCELLEFIHDLVYFGKSNAKKAPPRQSTTELRLKTTETTASYSAEQGTTSCPI